MQEYVYRFDKSYLNVSVDKFHASNGDLIYNFACKVIKLLPTLTYRIRLYKANLNSNEYTLEADQSFNLCRLQSISSNIVLRAVFEMMFKSANISIVCPILPVNVKENFVKLVNQKKYFPGK